MRRIVLAALALVVATPSARAQEPCVTPDSIEVRGNARIAASLVRSDAGILPGQPLTARGIQKAIRDLYATGNFEHVELSCAPREGGEGATLIIAVRERPVLGDVSVVGPDQVSERSVRDRVDLLIGRPIDPAKVAHIVARIDSLYESEGFYLARITPETTVVDGVTKLVFRVEEGRRLAISGIAIIGNQRIDDGQIVKAMKTRPEGFWWFQKGEFDEDVYALDLADRVPKLYGENGYVDAEVQRDTLIVDRERGKGLIEIGVSEGPQYRVGSFQVVGNRRFSTEELNRFYPFTGEGPSLGERVSAIVRRRPIRRGMFDRSRWEEATRNVSTAYSNEGYIRASVRPVVERTVGADSLPRVDLRWEISEGQPSIINRIEIVGNDHTTEACIRDAIVIAPGEVFNQDRLIRSWQNIGNLGFFETPMTPPDSRPANEEGDIDIIFTVKEKQTGNVNFGASVGQGTGLGGFIGLEQPNLFGQCKRVQLQAQFGYWTSFSLSYTDPSIKRSRISGTVSLYSQRLRYQIADLGRQTQTGGSLQFGFPLPRNPFARVLVSYGAERVSYSGGGLLGTQRGRCDNCFRSTLGVTGVHDTRIDLPFATGGSRRELVAQFTGGPLGGTSNYQRYTGELRSYALLGQVGGTKPGSQPIKFPLGLSLRGGAIFGDVGPFLTQRFAVGGTQFGEQVRGYSEFSITPDGYNPRADDFRADANAFGSAFFTATAELGVRINQMFYPTVFFDAGNAWRHPREFNPTRLFRGAGIGIATITPLGPLGLDWAYGFDRVDESGRPTPGWRVHFKLGQLF